MNKLFKLAALGALLLPNPSVLIAQTTQNPNLTTPKPITPVWENERDLIVLFDNSEDRVTLALQVMNLSLDLNNSLTPLQRFDGLSIAGHTLWSSAKYDSVIACFDGVIALNISNDATADAARMKAQAHFFKGEYQQATDAYLMCYNISKQLEAQQGHNNLADLVISMLIQSARRASNYDIAIQFADIALSDNTLRTDARQNSLRTGAQAALEIENNERAETYLTALLSEYPTFGMDFPGDRVNVEMDLVLSQGHSFDSKDPQAILAISDIVQNEEYFGMPTWAGAVSKLATMLEGIDDTPRANKLRLWAVDQIDIKSNSYDINDPNTNVKLLSGRKSQLGLLRKAEQVFMNMRQYEKQAEVLLRIVNDFADISPNTTQYANQQLNDLAQRDIVP